MSHGTLAASQHWSNLTIDRDCQWMQLYRDGLAHRAQMETRSESSVVTDSAAASSSWGGGQRIPNGRINVDADGKNITPLYTDGKLAGKRLGLVTTATISHATPAGFAANQLSRDHQDDIAAQYLEREVDILLGGGRAHVAADKRKDGRDLAGEFATAGYTVLNHRDALLHAPRQGRLLGTFSDGHIPYALDRANDAAIGARTPSLELMMTAALERLAGAPEGFLLQVEAGRVDHAAHANDPATCLMEQLEFDRCILLARRFAEQHPDTLVVITTDHGTGGFMLNGEGKNYRDSTAGLLRLSSPTASYETLAQRHRQVPLSGPAIAQSLGLPEARFAGPIGDAIKDWDGSDKKLGLALRPILAPWFAVAWTTQNHTAELAEFAAFGPGADAFPGFLKTGKSTRS